MARRWPFPAVSVFISVALAQSPADLFHKAPPDIDDALRARISEFYQLHVDARFRQAEQLVAEDSRDFFYVSNKPKYLSFEITHIEYSDNFTRAKATVVCETFVPVMGFMNKAIKAPIPSRWKIENGKWYWYVDPAMRNMTPFGEMKPGPGASSPGAPPAPHMPSDSDIQQLFNQVKPDKLSVRLGRSGSEAVAILNQMPGPVSLAIDGDVPAGVQATLDRKDVQGGEKAVLTLRPKPGAGPHAGVVNVRVLPTNQLIPIRISVE